ncbi:pyridoxal-phosphate dependent enzyme [Actinomycetospora lutea]|uniref:1-aminocyclopropane-1-carboxylate deaminase/D-cysteine desulfhydrase n=1 Tax=Actinomycetospora lutea TaxID=663604 RepID=UPI002365196F|nr:pyridoxal-phosphate dependent enzyme [Actinomycetospora lutea]MDD7938293.1 pyridoxal-phosphate dependent enzyme [Actinomycetospora lutea]
MTPRFPLAVLPTPLVRADRLRAALGCGPLWLKRDDLTGFGVAGNKVRALEYLLGDALARGCDVLVTGGGPDSNFVAAAAQAARVAGLDCELVVWGDVRGTTNLALATAAGARIHALGSDDRGRVDGEVDRLGAELAAAGRRPLAVPRGGSTPVGALGFAGAAAEVVAQWGGSDAPTVVLPVGSGGSVAGLLAGLAGTGWRVLGASVSRPPDEITAKVLGLAGETAALAGTASPRPEQLTIVDARGPGFGVASPADRAAADLVLGTEGVLLDDTYGAKAAAVAVEHRTDGPALLWLTGGLVSALTHVSEVPGYSPEVRSHTTEGAP